MTLGYWVVALFVMLGGYNMMSSYFNRGQVLVRQKLLKLFWPYLLATIFYTLGRNHYLDAIELLTRLLHFDATEPLYYIAVYMQLIFISPILIAMINWCEKKYKYARMLIICLFILIFCYLSVHLTNIFGIGYGGGNLCAGPWLMFWFFGMCIRFFRIPFAKKSTRVTALVTYTIILIIWQFIFVNRGYNLFLKPIFGGTQVGMTWANAFEATLLFFWFRELIEGFEKTTGKIGTKLLLPFNYIGCHTLYIFMYHMLFFSIYKSYFEISGIMNRWLCLIFIFGGPIVLEVIITMVMKWFRNIMQGIKVDDIYL